LLRPAPEEITAVVEQLVEESRERVRLRLIDVFSERNRSEKLGWQTSTITQRAEAFLAEIWQGEGRYAWCDAKESVLPRLREQFRQRYEIQLSDPEIVAAVRNQDISADLRQVVEALAAFVGEEN
jgi:hypothetical protein